MAMKTARQWARKHRPEIIKPKIVAPVTAHPAFIKSAHYLDMQIEFTALRDDWRAGADAIKAAVDDDTVILVGSAICYPYGVVDPIQEIAAIADERGILMHVDGCLGGFMLPFVSKLGYEVPIWDFRAKGVTSISADVHKYGYAAKGASTVTYRDAELRRAAAESRMVLGLTARAMRRTERLAFDEVLSKDVSGALRRVPVDWPAADGAAGLTDGSER